MQACLYCATLQATVIANLRPLCFWLSHLGIFRSAETIREEVVQYLEEHPNNAEGIPLQLFVAVPWSQYMREMLTDDTYGDQLTFQTAADFAQY